MFATNRNLLPGEFVPGEKVVVRMTADGRVSRCALASVCGSWKAFESRDN